MSNGKDKVAVDKTAVKFSEEQIDQLCSVFGLDRDLYKKEGLLKVIGKKLGTKTVEEVLAAYENKKLEKLEKLPLDVQELDWDTAVELLDKLKSRFKTDGKTDIELKIALAGKLQKKGLSVAEALALKDTSEKKGGVASYKVMGELDLTKPEVCVREHTGVPQEVYDLTLYLQAQYPDVVLGRYPQKKPCYAIASALGKFKIWGNLGPKYILPEHMSAEPVV